MQEARRKLPAFQKRAELLAALEQHRVLVISGATGVEPFSFSVRPKEFVLLT